MSVTADLASTPPETAQVLPQALTGQIAQRLFGFEADYARSLCCMPMIVRYRLDVCRIKLALRDWQRFCLETRARLILDHNDEPSACRGYRRTLLVAIVDEARSRPVRLTQRASEVWAEPTLPPSVRQYADDKGFALDGSRSWRDLTVLQRYALCKLTRVGHENRNFGAALVEFGLSASAH